MTNWQTTPPTVPGFYWMRISGGSIQPVYVHPWMEANLNEIEYWPERIQEPDND